MHICPKLCFTIIKYLQHFNLKDLRSIVVISASFRNQFDDLEPLGEESICLHILIDNERRKYSRICDMCYPYHTRVSVFIRILLIVLSKDTNQLIIVIDFIIKKFMIIKQDLSVSLGWILLEKF